MIQKRILPLSAALLAAILAGSPSAWAQEPDDFEFTRHLAYRGWFDLAYEVCERIARDPNAPGEVRSGIPILKAEIELAKADRETDPIKSRQFVDESIQMLQKFIREHANHPRMLEAKINIGWLKCRKAKGLVDQMESEKNPEEHARLRKEATALYGEVAAEFKAHVATLLQTNPMTPEAEGAIIDMRLEWPRAMYEHAKIPGLSEDERKKLLKDAADLLVEYEIDYGDRAKAFEAMLLEGQCHMEIPDYSQAEAKLKNVLVLPSVLHQAKLRRDRYFDQILYGAYLSLAQLYLRSGRPADAVKFIDTTLAGDARAASDWIANALAVEKVEAYFKLRKNADAQALANKVINADPNGFFASKMREKVRLAGLSSGVKMTPEAAITAADSHIERARYRDAMAALRQAIEGCRTEADRAKYASVAWYKMGQCLQELRRNYEAAIAFEKVFTQFEKHELAPKACWEAVVCYSMEFESSGDKRDDDQKDRYMEVLASGPHRTHPVAKNIPYLQGLKLEAAGQLKEAAAKYALVPAEAEGYERALVRGGYCLRVDAMRRWHKTPKDETVKPQLLQAEAVFMKFLERFKNTPAPDEESAKARSALELIANQELATIYIHPTIGRAEECLKFLEEVAKRIPADDERLAKILGSQIQANLALGRVEPAVKTLDLLFERFPDGVPTAQASKSVAIRLDEMTEALIKAPPPRNEKLIKENLEKISQYYRKWLDGAMAFGLNATITDVKAVAETLYMIAKRLNDLDESISSFIDLKGKIVAWKKYWERAAFVHTLLVTKWGDKLPEKDRLLLMTRLARCHSFGAETAADWTAAKNAYEDIMRAFKATDDKSGQLNMQALQAQPQLLNVYLELGHVYVELARRGTPIQYDNAINVFANVAGVAGGGGELWWMAKYMAFTVMFQRGKGQDITMTKVGIDNLERNYPNFDDDKFGMKTKFEALRKQVDQALKGR